MPQSSGGTAVALFGIMSLAAVSLNAVTSLASAQALRYGSIRLMLGHSARSITGTITTKKKVPRCTKNGCAKTTGKSGVICLCFAVASSSTRTI